MFIEFTFHVWPGVNKTPAAVSITNQATLVTGIKAKHFEWVEKNYLLPLILRFLLKHSNICRWWFIFQSKLKSKRLIRKSKKIFALVVSSQTSVSDVINFFAKKSNCENILIGFCFKASAIFLQTFFHLGQFSVSLIFSNFSFRFKLFLFYCCWQFMNYLIVN